MPLSYRQFCIQDTDDVCRLLNDTSIRRHLPLASMAGSFSVEFVQQWIARSRAHWQEHGYGIWQIERDGEFIGWGGCQVFNGEREFGPSFLFVPEANCGVLLVPYRVSATAVNGGGSALAKRL